MIPSLVSGTCPSIPSTSTAKSLSPTTATLKRSRSTSSTTPTMDPGCPSAPHIDGEAMLEIFVHSSINITGKPMNSESVYADGPRLATIGRAMLEASYAAILFNKRPMLTAEELEVSCRSHTLFVPSTIAVCHRPVVASFRIWLRNGLSNTSGEKRCAMLPV